MAAIDFEVRRAVPTDAGEIAAAHLDSIRSIGAGYYDPAIVNDWAANVKGDLYTSAMASGEVFYIAVATVGKAGEVLGFSSHRIDDGDHRTAVYVRGSAARRGVGSALFRRAEASAVAAGAASINVAGSRGFLPGERLRADRRRPASPDVRAIDAVRLHAEGTGNRSFRSGDSCLELGEARLTRPNR